MSQANSRGITTSQTQVHDKLGDLIGKYRNTDFRRPISEHTQAAFDQAQAWLDNWSGPIIIDSCCGVGDSTAQLAQRYPDARILGIDKSIARLDKHASYASSTHNYQVIRADVNDFWRLVAGAQWPVQKHYLLYPNPYPKPGQLQKRWHGSPAFLALLAMGGALEIRSNWEIYVREAQFALAQFGIDCQINPISTPVGFTPFERKYLASGQTCWQLQAENVTIV